MGDSLGARCYWGGSLELVLKASARRHPRLCLVKIMNPIYWHSHRLRRINRGKGYSHIHATVKSKKLVPFQYSANKHRGMEPPLSGPLFELPVGFSNDVC